jgi:hypothetical protein
MTSITRWLARGTGLMATLALLTAACGGESGGDITSPGDPGSGAEEPGTPGGTPGAQVPADVVGTWYAGNVSSSNFYTPSTGHWDNAGGTGQFYTLKGDGTFEYGWRIYSTLYGCSMSAMVFRQGTIEVQASSTLVLHTTYAVMHSEDTCNASGNYDKTIPLETETLIWELGQDEMGNAALYLRGPDTTPSAFYPRDF